MGAALTQRELDQTKGELVRALRRRASELDATVAPVEAKVPRRHYSTVAAQPRKPQAFFLRETFLAVALPVSATVEAEA